MKYYGEFVGKNGKTYRVEMTTATTGDDVEVTIAAGGLVTTIDSGNDIFRRLKCGGATVSIIIDDEPTDLWSGKATGVPVAIYEDGTEIWCGWTTPNIYSQKMAPRAVQMDIQCVDCLSVLSDIDFTSVNTSGLTTFVEYIQKALTVAGGGVHALNFKYVEPWTDKAIANLIVMEANWWDEEGETKKWSEILKDLLTYANMQITQVGTTIYGNDIRQEIQEAWIIAGDETPWARTLTEIDNYKLDAFPKLSMSEVYQKLKISVSLYNDSSVLPDLWNDDAVEIATEDYTDYEGSFKSKVYSAELSFYSHPKATLYNYNTLTRETVAHVDSVAKMISTMGAWIIKMACTSGADIRRGGTSDQLIMKLPSINKYLALACHQSIFENTHNDWNTDAVGALPMMKFSISEKRVFPALFYLILSGTIRYENSPYPYINPDWTTAGKGVQEDMYIYMMLRIGDKYYNYSSLENVRVGYVGGHWTTEPTKFKVYIAENSTSRYTYDDEKKWVNTDFIFRNNVESYMGIDATGLAIEIAADDHVSGDMELTIYAPGPEANPVTLTPSYMWIKDLKLTIERSLTWEQRNASDKDIEYKTVIDSQNAKEMSDVRMTVATDVGRKYSRASVIERSGTEGAYTYAFAKETTSKYDSDGAEIPEKHLLSAMYEQYKQPREKIECTARGLLIDYSIGAMSTTRGKRYIVNGCTNDYDNNKCKLTLEEIR